MVGVAVCICTCQRPKGLARLLDHLARIDWAGTLRVAVVDNDPAQEGITVCRRLSGTYRWSLSWGFEAQRGISFARNHAVALALQSDPDFIAMLDDDEWPSPQWLGELLRVQSETGADVVGAPVLPVFPRDARSWVEHARECYGSDQPIADGAPCMLYASGNFIASARCFQVQAPEFFRSDFAISGGEDAVFFLRLRELGFRLHWSAGAIVYESVPECRLSLDWVRQRMILKGNIQVRMFRLYAPGLPHEAWRGAKTCGLVTAGAANYLIGLLHGPTRIRAAMMLWRARGRIQAHLGRTLTRPDGIEGV